MTARLFSGGLALFALGLLLIALPRTSAQTASVRFAVIGDYGSGEQQEADVANVVRSWNPDFVITVGDNNYGSKTFQDYDRNVGQFYHEFIYPYAGQYGAGAAGQNRFFPTLGNKDWSSSTGYAAYSQFFTLPNNERYYDFAAGPAHFFMLNSDSHEPDGITSTSVQAAWLQSRMAAASAPWRLVFLHHAPYSSTSNTSEVRWPFGEWGASAVVVGHAHVYERLYRNGVRYFVNGVGGEDIVSFGTTIAGSEVRFNGDFGAQLVEANPDSITFQFITRTGQLVDTYTVLALAAPSNVAATAVSDTEIRLNWTDEAGAEDGFEVERSADGVSFAPVALVGRNATSYLDTGLQAMTAYVYRVRSVNAGGASAYSTPAAAMTKGPLTPPAGLTATATASSKIKLTWQDNSTGETGFEIERSLDGSAFTQIKTVSAGVTSYTSSSLSALTTYYYRVRAFDATTASPWSNTASATTWVPKPEAPTGLTATAMPAGEVALSWTDNSAHEAGVQVYRATGTGSFSRIVTLAGANLTAYTDTRRTPGTQYSYRVRAYNVSGTSAYSNTVSVTALP